MRPLSSSELLNIWEWGQSQPPVERALMLIEIACPELTRERLAALSIGQLDARLLTLREWSFGSQVVSLADCPQCGERLEQTFGVGEIRMPEREDPPATFSLEVEDYSVRFRLLNSQDLAALTQCFNPAAARRQLLERCVLSLVCRGEDARAEPIPESVANGIAEQMSQADPEGDIQLAISCAACGHQWHESFDITSFFWAEITGWARRTLYEVHLLAVAYGWRESDILAMSPWRRQTYLNMVRT